MHRAAERSPDPTRRRDQTEAINTHLLHFCLTVQITAMTIGTTYDNKYRPIPREKTVRQKKLRI